jgi:hypothetical protein
LSHLSDPFPSSFEGRGLGILNGNLRYRLAYGIGWSLISQSGLSFLQNALRICNERLWFLIRSIDLFEILPGAQRNLWFLLPAVNPDRQYGPGGFLLERQSDRSA